MSLLILLVFVLWFFTQGLQLVAAQPQCRLVAPGVRAGSGTSTSSAPPATSTVLTTSASETLIASASSTSTASATATPTPSLAPFNYGVDPIRGVNLYVNHSLYCVACLTALILGRWRCRGGWFVLEVRRPLGRTSSEMFITIVCSSRGSRRACSKASTIRTS